MMRTSFSMPFDRYGGVIRPSLQDQGGSRLDSLVGNGTRGGRFGRRRRRRISAYPGRDRRRARRRRYRPFSTRSKAGRPDGFGTASRGRQGGVRRPIGMKVKGKLVPKDHGLDNVGIRGRQCDLGFAGRFYARRTGSRYCCTRVPIHLGRHSKVAAGSGTRGTQDDAADAS